MGHGWDRVDITIGGYSWTTRATDTAAIALNQFMGRGYPNKGVVCDGLTIAWETDDTRPGYSQPKPWEADFSILVPAMTDLVDIGTGATVCIKVWARPPGELGPTPWDIPRPPLALFLGRVADVEANRAGPGVRFTFSCVDYTADLMELQVGAIAWPAQTAANRVGQITAEAGIVVDIGPLPPAHVAARDAAAISVYDALSETFQGIVDNSPFSRGEQRVIAVGQLTDAVTDTIPAGNLFDLPRFLKGQIEAPASATMLIGPWETPQPGVLGGPTTAVDIVISPILTGRFSHMQAFPASNVADDLVFQYRKGQSVDSVVITRDNIPVVTRSLEATPTATFVQETLTDDPAEQANIADFLLPDASETGWSVDTVTLVDLEPSQVQGLMLMVPDSLDLVALSRSSPVVIYDLPPNRSADATDWYAGTPTAARLVFSKGRYSITTALAHRVSRAEYQFGLPDPASDYDGYLSCDNLRTDPTYAAIRPVDVVRSVTYYDLRIVRSHDA